MNNGIWSLKSALRRLWADHVIWTRQYVVAAVGNGPDADAAAARLLKNQEDLGNAVVPFYGEAAGAGLTDLLKQHIAIAVELIDAAKSGDEPRFQERDAAWDSNAREIASFLSGANPHWPEQDVYDLLNLHLTLTKNEVVARLEQKWEADVAAFDEILTEILTVSDVLADGLVAQFPDRFGA